MITRERGGLLRTRDFRLLWAGETTSVLGSSIAVVALPLVAVVTLQASTFAVGLLTAAAWLPWLDLLTMTQLLVVALAGGVAKVFFNVAYRAYLPSLVDQENLLEANAKMQGSESVAQIGGPGLAGPLAQGFGAVSGVLADAVIALLFTPVGRLRDFPAEPVSVP